MRYSDNFQFSYDVYFLQLTHALADESFYRDQSSFSDPLVFALEEEETFEENPYFGKGFREFKEMFSALSGLVRRHDSS